MATTHLRRRRERRLLDWRCLIIAAALSVVYILRTHHEMPITGITVLDSKRVTDTYRFLELGSVVAAPQETVNMTTPTKLKPPKILYVTFSHLLDFSRFERFIFPALHTYLIDDVYHVVLSMNWKTKYYNELCTDAKYQNDCQRILPIFVDCPEGKIGISPCCKQEKGLLEVHEMYSSKDGSSESENYWIAFMDDDNYLRSTHLRDFLSQFPNAPHNDPMIVIAGGKRTERALGQQGFSRFPPYPCSSMPDHTEFTYPWGQPVFYSRSAMDLIVPGLQHGGLVQVCWEYKVSHDVGNAIFHWMHSLAAFQIRLFQSTNRDDGQSFGVHGVFRDHGQTKWGKAELRDMQTVHQIFQQSLYNISTIPVIWHNVSGFRKTKTFRSVGDPSKWNDTETWQRHVTVDDCLDPRDAKIAPTIVGGTEERIKTLRYKCANILNRLAPPINQSRMRRDLTQYRQPCRDAFRTLFDAPEGNGTPAVADLERKLEGFPAETPWLYFEESLGFE